VKKIGVLALQGDFAAHEKALARLGVASVEIRETKQFNDIDGLIIPGGESTVMLKLLRADQLMEPLRAFIKVKPVFGTCAGAILLAKTVTGPAQESLGVMDMDVERNAYGRQRESQITEIDLEPVSASHTGANKMEAVFIRAPIIRTIGPGVKVLARYQGNPVLVQQGHHMAATFHPELTNDLRVHKSFIEML